MTRSARESSTWQTGPSTIAAHPAMGLPSSGRRGGRSARALARQDATAGSATSAARVKNAALQRLETVVGDAFRTGGC